MQVVLGVADALACPAVSDLRWHVEINNDLDLGDVNTAGKQVSGDDDADLAGAELRNHLVTLFVAHVTEDDAALKVRITHHLVQSIGVALRVKEDHCLRHLADVED